MTTLLPPALHSLWQALDAAPQSTRFFLRDDDAGWDDPRLMALLDACLDAGAPIDLAVIPRATGAALAHMLLARRRRCGGLLGLHQHGYAHANHESTGRKGEFSGARGSEAQALDLRAGQIRLQALLGDALDPIFTPPWNRCCSVTPGLLKGLGFAALSRSRSAPAQQDLPELPIDVDWCKERREADQKGTDVLARVAQALLPCVASGQPVGLMLHHAAMDAFDRERLGVLLQHTRRHPRVAWRPMRQLL